MSSQLAVEVPPCSQETPQQGHDFKEGDNLMLIRPEYRNEVWDRYIEDFLIGSDQVTEAAIIERESGEYLAKSAGFKLHPDEYQQILISLCHAQMAYRNGVTINNQYYKTRLADGSRGIFARTEGDGCTVCQTGSLVIIGIHDENCCPRRCNEEVMTLGDYFFNKGM